MCAETIDPIISTAVARWFVLTLEMLKAMYCCFLLEFPIDWSTLLQQVRVFPTQNGKNSFNNSNEYLF